VTVSKRTADLSALCDVLLRPVRLFSRDEVLARDCPVPAAGGVYGCYFNPPPPMVPVAECQTVGP
jgi:hypothetical protein